MLSYSWGCWNRNEGQLTSMEMGEVAVTTPPDPNLLTHLICRVRIHADPECSTIRKLVPSRPPGYFLKPPYFREPPNIRQHPPTPALPALGVRPVILTLVGAGDRLFLPHVFQNPITQNPSESHHDQREDDRDHWVLCEESRVCHIGHLHVGGRGWVWIPLGRVGGRSSGKLLVVSINIQKFLAEKPIARARRNGEDRSGGYE